VRDTEDEALEATDEQATDLKDEKAAALKGSPAGWAELLEYLRSTRGFDFHGYKPTTLMRRVRKRMEQVQLDDFGAYRDYLEVHPDEFALLFNTILINVTSFFRDPQAWEVVRTQVIPDIIANRPKTEPIRVWSAGCATGEEAYTLAIILAEALGIEEFKQRAKIYATDVDEEALTHARHAAYSERAVEGVPDDLKQRYFEKTDSLYIFRKDLRRLVIFGRHDLMNDAPISRIDLLVCRNALMYFNAEAQSRILSRFHFALNDGGYLFLGRAETLMTHNQAFSPVDLKRRVCRKIRGGGRDRPFAGANGVAGVNGIERPVQTRLKEATLETSPVAVLVLDLASNVVFVNDRARLLFGLSSADVGRPFQDLQLSYRPVELRSVIEQATAEHRPIAVKDIEWRTPAGERRWFDVQVTLLADVGNGPMGISVTFTDTTLYRRLQAELEQANQELETAYEELQSTNEELETTNEELQSTVEELETTNEELQSTNEELETMNEELQSTNEELQTINDELRERSDELNSANAFLNSVLTSLRGGVAVVDRDLKVLGWNRHAEDLWGLRSDEVNGQHLLNLDIGLPLDKLRPVLRGSLGGDGHQTLQLDAINRRGRPVKVRVTCSPLAGAADEIRGVIIHMEPVSEGDGSGNA
jgi:two-component system CheB/CheR fusion protein